MNLRILRVVALAASTSSLASAMTSPGGSLRGERDRSLLPDELVGTFVEVIHEFEQKESESSFGLELIGGEFYDIDGAPPGWTAGLKSGVDRISVPAGVELGRGRIDMRGASPGRPRPLLPVSAGPPGGADDVGRDRESNGRRRLAAVEGMKTVLAVRVIKTGLNAGALTRYNDQYAPQDTKEQIADDIFGVSIHEGDPANFNGDLVNLHSQVLACSHGKLNFQPTGDRTSAINTVTNIVDGMVEVEVTTACDTACDSAMNNDVNNALVSAFLGGSGSSADLADYVMLCLPEGAMNGTAYASVNSWRSVYKNKWCQYVGTQMHELGHNINLDHSNEGSQEYADETGVMGYGHSIDDQAYCYNNAKSHQLGWFKDATKTVGLYDAFEGPINGQINYNPFTGPSQNPVIIQVETTISNTKYYVGFNHAKKHNVNTDEAGNQVVVQSYAGSGYAPSYKVAALSAGGVWTKTVDGHQLTVQVNTINTNDDTGYASVRVSYGQCSSDTDCDNSNQCTIDTCGGSGACSRVPIPNCCGNGQCESLQGEVFNTCLADCAEGPLEISAPSCSACYAGREGNMFEIEAKDTDIAVTSVKMKAYHNGAATGEVWTRPGTMAGYQTSSVGWTKVLENSFASIVAWQMVDFPEFDQAVVVPAGAKQSFYVTFQSGQQVLFGPGTSLSTVSAEDNNLKIFHGLWSSYPFGGAGTYNGWGAVEWNGSIEYIRDGNTFTLSPTTASTDLPTVSPTKNPTDGPTKNPTNSPSARPTNPEPTTRPTLEPTLTPTKEPTNWPTVSPTTSGPSVSPTKAPTVSPSISPTTRPSVSPTKNPTASPSVSPTKDPTTSPTGAGFCSDGSARCVDVTDCACNVPARRLLKGEVVKKANDDKMFRQRKLKKTPAPTVAQTPEPTSSPITSNPTARPVTPPPTVSPTPPPTMACACLEEKPLTSSPTSSPTPFPTSPPTNEPTPPPTEACGVKNALCTNDPGSCCTGFTCQLKGGSYKCA